MAEESDLQRFRAEWRDEISGQQPPGPRPREKPQPGSDVSPTSISSPCKIGIDRGDHLFTDADNVPGTSAGDHRRCINCNKLKRQTQSENDCHNDSKSKGSKYKTDTRERPITYPVPTVGVQRKQTFVDDLLAGIKKPRRGLDPECSTSEHGRSEFLETRNKRLKLSEQSLQSERELCNCSFLDQFIADVNEITEIPFFDTELPRELAVKIFYHLDVVDLCRCSQVSKAWKSIAEDELLWTQICLRLGYAEEAVTIEKAMWKMIVMQHVLQERQIRHNWKMRIGEVEPLEYVKGGILCAASSWKSNLVAGYSSGEVSVWDIEKEDHTILEPSSTALVINEAVEWGTVRNTVIGVCMNDQIVAASYTQGNVDVWKVDNKKPSPDFTVNINSPVSSMVCSSTDSLLAMSSDNKIHIHRDADLVNQINAESHVFQLCMVPSPPSSKDHNLLIRMDGSVKLYKVGDDPMSMKTVHKVMNHYVHYVDANEKDIAIGLGTDGQYFVKLYDAATGGEVISLQEHEWGIEVMNIHDSPANSLITGCKSGRVCIYDTRCTYPVLTLVAAPACDITCVQMDDWKAVSGSKHGMVSVWDIRMAAQLWEQHNRHAVDYLHFKDHLMFVANVPIDKLLEEEEGDSLYHKRYRGTLSLYNFREDTSSPSLPSNVFSTYDEPEGYSYNIHLTVPYDNV